MLTNAHNCKAALISDIYIYIGKFASKSKKLFSGIKGQMPECHQVARCKKPVMFRLTLGTQHFSPLEHMEFLILMIHFT